MGRQEISDLVENREKSWRCRGLFCWFLFQSDIHGKIWGTASEYKIENSKPTVFQSKCFYWGEIGVGRLCKGPRGECFNVQCSSSGKMISCFRVFSLSYFRADSLSLSPPPPIPSFLLISPPPLPSTSERHN
jgi:hypothetical protein